MSNAVAQARRPTYVVTFFLRYVLSSLPGMTPQVGFTRLAAHYTAQLGQARVAVQSISFRRRMDARVEPAHDDREIASSRIHVPHQPAKRRHRGERSKRRLEPLDATPKHRLVAVDDRLAECLLDIRDRLDLRRIGAAQENAVGLRPVVLAD